MPGSEYYDTRYCMTTECMHIPASGLGLYYIAGDKEDASHFDSHNRVFMANFGEYFVEIFQ